jgi:NADH:ubiquinone reductase (H+-translocating)
MERVVVVGGGFAGIEAARYLSRKPVEVVLVDRRNHYLFQPLLYQVATAVLSPEEIATPIRSVLSGRPTVRVILDTVSQVDLVRHTVRLSRDELSYDRLVLACGGQNAYFGHEEWAPYTMGLKDLDDALAIRRRVLSAFEQAEAEATGEARRTLLTFAVVGGGPTGVELAGALAEIALLTVRHDFHHVRPEEVRIVLLEGGARLLPTFPEDMAQYADRTLRHLGVEVRTSALVQAIGNGFVDLETERLRAHTVLWAAGVQPAALAGSLDVPKDLRGRLLVESDLSLPGHPEVFAAGDAVHVEHEGGLLPGVAPVAMQEGHAVAVNVWRSIEGRPTEPFRYRDKGNLATIGRSRALCDLGRVRLKGRPAWLIWLFVHILYLAGFENRLVVAVRWAWAYMVYKRSARLIYGAEPEQAEEELKARERPGVSA